MTVTITPLTGPELTHALDDLARLRIAVFRAFPYLYDGTLEYEAKYLREFAHGRDGIIVAAKDADSIVGCATGCALSTQHAALQQPFRDRGDDIDGIFYCGESVLLPDYRGRGIGHAFFDHREAQARRCGYTLATFCGVVRPDDHPARPAGYIPLDAFWQKRGYRKAEGLTTTFGWKDVGEPAETDKPMQFWVKALWRRCAARSSGGSARSRPDRSRRHSGNSGADSSAAVVAAVRRSNNLLLAGLGLPDRRQ